MLLMPPRHGKSELASKSYPAWCLGRRPSRHFIACSASAELARDVGRSVRNIVRSAAYRFAFSGVTLNDDDRAAGRWTTSQGGSWYSVGIGGDIMGRGADIVLVDDPFGTSTDAASPVIRESVWKWYTGTIYNRLEPKGAIVLINHRLHEDDLSGRLIEKMKAGDSDADQWTIVQLPAIADSKDDLLRRQIGEALWPERFPLKELERRRANMFGRDWSALYQQQPVPDEGEFFSPR